jgi:hypothetical protein
VSNKQKVLRRFPKAYCYQSSLTANFFVMTGGRYEHIIGYKSSPQAAWKQAAKKGGAK